MIKESTRLIDKEIITFMKDHPKMLLKEIAHELKITEARLDWARRRSGDRRKHPRKTKERRKDAL